MTAPSKSLVVLSLALLFAGLDGFDVQPAHARHRLIKNKKAKATKAAKTAKATKSALRTSPRSKARPHSKLKLKGPVRSVKDLRGAQLRSPAAKLLAPKATAKAPARNKLLKNRSKIKKFQGSYGGERKKVLANQGADTHVAKVMSHSEANGEYHIISDLHWGHGKTANGKWDAREDFRKGQTFGKFVNQIAKSKRGVSLIVGGDWLELMEQVNANASPAEVKKAVTEIVEGHKVEAKALAKGIVKNGLRLIYLAGNHDVHLVDSNIRAHG
jgi:hypothetical protein